MNEKIKSPIGEILSRYARVWKAAWAERKAMEPPKRYKDEAAFLPAHLELIETPVSAAPKWVGRLIILFAVLTLTWAIIGQLDIVAVTQGKTIVTGHSKVIQSLENAVVKKVYVENGQAVQAGEILIDLSAIGAEADYAGAKQSLQAERLNQLRQRLLLQALEQKQFSPILNTPLKTSAQTIDNSKALSVAAISNATTLAQSQYQTWQTQDSELSGSLAQRKAEKTTLTSEISSLKQLNQIEKQRLNDLTQLYNKDYIAKHTYLEQKRKSVEINSQLQTKQNRLSEIDAAIEQVTNNRLLKKQSFKSEALDQLRQANEKIDALQFTIHKARERQKLMTLKSPVNGTVQQLATHTVGGVVTAAQPIMVIVPESNELQAEVMIANKDIGFVKPGQEAIVKIESFPYTRYGYLTGKVKNVTFDAIEHEKLGLVFSGIMTLNKSQLTVEGKVIDLSAGMNITAEIKTGKRRVIDYLLSPLQTKIDESFKER